MLSANKQKTMAKNHINANIEFFSTANVKEYLKRTIANALLMNRFIYIPTNRHLSQIDSD
jgi:hypothetical protein